MARKVTAQIQKHFSNPHFSSSSTNNPKYENVGAKSIWDTNVRQLRHQTSFGGVSYLDVIKERERSDSGFSGDVYDELSNQDQFLNNISENDGFSRLFQSPEYDEKSQQKSTPPIKTSNSTTSFPIVSSSRNINSRRESYDSGLSISPTTHTPPQFDIDFDASYSKPNNHDTHDLEQNDNERPETRNEISPPPARRRKKKKRLCGSLSVTQFCDVYRLTGETLGEGSYGKVEECENIITKATFAVKIISKKNVTFSRPKMLKEIELYFLCQGVPEIIQLIEYFEETDFFYLVFEKAKGGPLLSQIQRRVHFGEHEAASIIRDLAAALSHLHSRGIAHRDVKPENVLCYNDGERDGDFLPVKLCDFDLCSSVCETISTPKLQSPVGSVEYMAPEVVEAFSYDIDFFGHELQPDTFDDEEDIELTYDKRCDLWSLGIVAYILLCGYVPFSGRCGKDCGWEDRGEECLECQHQLFQSIKSGNVIFPEKPWSGISEEAKDLIAKLLVRDASQRLDAISILNHPWIIKHNNAGQPNNREESTISSIDLETPKVLRRKSRQETIFYSEFASNALAIKRNCVDHHGAITSSKKPMIKSSTVSEVFDTVDVSSSNEMNLEDAMKKIESSPIDVCQMNNNHQLPSYIKSKFSRDDTDENTACNTSNNTKYPHTNIIHSSGETQSQHRKSMNRQQSCQDFLTHSSQFSKHMKRQNSLVAFATDYENDMNEKGCRWEF
jgi:MAP kinase interacting serine/threonine kinase